MPLVLSTVSEPFLCTSWRAVIMVDGFVVVFSIVTSLLCDELTVITAQLQTFICAGADLRPLLWPLAGVS